MLPVCKISTISRVFRQEIFLVFSLRNSKKNNFCISRNFLSKELNYLFLDDGVRKVVNFGRNLTFFVEFEHFSENFAFFCQRFLTISSDFAEKGTFDIFVYFVQNFV